MKNHYTIITLFVISFILTTYQGYSQTTFSKVFGPTNQFAANAVTPTSNNHFIIAGQAGNKGYVLKIDSAGNAIWSKTVSGNYFNCITTTKDAGFIVAGGNGITKLNAAGNIEWSKTIAATEHINITSIKQTYDSGFILSGYANRSDLPLYSPVFFAKLNVNGDVQWTKFGTPGDNINRAVSIKQATDSSYFVAGYYVNNNVNQYTTNVFLAKLTESGNVLWQKSYASSDRMVLQDFEITETGILLYANIFYTPILIKANFSGNIQWSKSYNISSSDPQSRGSIYNRVHKTTDGSFVFTSVGCNNANTFVKIDSLGGVTWARALKLIVAEGIPTKDDGYLLVGTGRDCDGVFMTDNNAAIGNEIGIIKINSSGNSTQINSCINNITIQAADFTVNTYYINFTLSSSLPVTELTTSVINDLTVPTRLGCITPGGGAVPENNFKNSISISPNPVSTQTTLLATIPLKNATLSIYNSIGQKVKQLNNISGKAITLERGNLPGGLYFIQITSSEKTDDVITKKMLITVN